MRRRFHFAAAPVLWALSLLLVAPSYALQVVSHDPAFFALGVSTSQTITVTFDDPLNAATVTPGSVIVRGLMSGVHTSALEVNGATLTINPDDDFFVGESVTVNLTKTLAESGGGAVLSNGYSFQFHVQVHGGSLDLTEFDSWSMAPTDVPYYIYGGDLDGNGTPDVITPNEDSRDIAVFLNSGDMVLDNHSTHAVGSTPSSCFGDDLDLDGDIDVAVANIGSSEMSVLKNNGSGVFSNSVFYFAPSVCRQVRGGDFDGDGDTDLVTTGTANDVINLFFNQGNGNFNQRVPIVVGDQPFPVFVADMNKDGLPDIIVGFQGTIKKVQVFPNQGNGSFVAGTSQTVGIGAWDMYGGDYNADGNFDIALAEFTSNNIRILLGNGTGGFLSATAVPTGSHPLGVFSADLDGDDDLDVLASDFGNADIRVFENSGSGTFTQADILVTQSSGSYAWPHDLDGDGDLDVTGIDELQDRIYVFENEGVVGVGDPGGVAPGAAFTLLAPHPNPAARGMAIGFHAPAALEHVTLRIFSADGRLVRTLLGGARAAGQGELSWDGETAEGRRAPAGVYFLRLDAREVGGREVQRISPARLTLVR